jgi:putative cell wall-binding protein
MEKEFKKIIEQSKKSLEKAEEKIEELSENFTDEVSEVWGVLKNRFAGVNDKLKDAYKEFEGESELQAHLSMMEARDKLEKIKESAENFAITTSKKTNEEFDMATLKAHLAKMDAEDKWEETKKRIIPYLWRV